MAAVMLESISWPELSEVMSGIEVAIIPTGSCEQHGPNQTFTTDTERARAVARLVAERLEQRVLVCPTVPYGVSPHHMGYPGTITLRVETYISLLTDVCLSLRRHGIERILFLNGHGGNRHCLGVVCAKLYHEHGMRSAFSGVGADVSADFWDSVGASEIRGHACEAEVSQSLYLAPQVVREDRLAPGRIIDCRYGRRVAWGEYFWPFHEITANGALGDATKASAELGERATELVVQRVVEFVTGTLLGKPDRGRPDAPNGPGI